jgi:hypothetical protein
MADSQPKGKSNGSTNAQAKAEGNQRQYCKDASGNAWVMAQR